MSSSPRDSKHVITESEMSALFLGWKKRTYRIKSVASREDVASLIALLAGGQRRLVRSRSAPQLKAIARSRPLEAPIAKDDNSQHPCQCKHDSANAARQQKSEKRMTIAIAEGAQDLMASALAGATQTSSMSTDNNDVQPNFIAQEQMMSQMPTVTPKDKGKAPIRYQDGQESSQTLRQKDSALSSPQLQRSNTSLSTTSQSRYREYRPSCSSPTPTTTSFNPNRHSMINLSELDQKLNRERELLMQLAAQQALQQSPSRALEHRSKQAIERDMSLTDARSQVFDAENMLLRDLRLVIRHHYKEALANGSIPAFTQESNTVIAGSSSGARIGYNKRHSQGSFDAAQAALRFKQWNNGLDSEGRVESLPVFADMMREQMIADYQEAKLRAEREAQLRRARESARNALLCTAGMNDLRRQAMRRMQSDADVRYQQACLEQAVDSRVQEEEDETDRVARMLSKLRSKMPWSKSKDL